MPTLPRHCLVSFGDYKQKDKDVNVEQYGVPEAKLLFWRLIYDTMIVLYPCKNREQ